MDYTQQEHPPEQGASASKHSAAPHRMRDHLKAYQDGELSSLRHRWVGWHVGKCAVCQAEIAVLQRLARDMQGLERATPRPQLRDRILASLPDAPPVASAVSPRTANARSAFGAARRPTLALGGAYAALLLLMAGAFALNQLNHWQRTAAQAGSGSRQAAVAPLSLKPFAPDSLAANREGGASRAAQSAEPAHAVGDPFSPAASSGMLPETSSASPRLASENTSTPSRTPTQETNRTAANEEGYTDSTSLAAEKLAARTLPDKLEAERHNAAAPEWQPARLIVQAPRSKNGAMEATQVAFAVTDVSEARRQVQRWAEETGAKVTALTPSGRAVEPGTSETTQTPSLLQIQVPVQQADVFKSRLNQMGTPLLPAGNAVRLAPHPVAVQDNAPGNSPRPSAAPASIDGAEKAAEKPGHRDVKTTVTILLRLQSGSRIPH